MPFGLASYIEERRKRVDEILGRRPPVRSAFLSPIHEARRKAGGKGSGKRRGQGKDYLSATARAGGIQEGIEETGERRDRAISPLPQCSTQPLRAIAEHIIQRRR